MINLNNVKQILVFDNPYDLFVECELDEKLTDDQKLYFSSVWDFEDFALILINSKYVVVTESDLGTVISDVMTIKQYFTESVDYYNAYETGAC